MADYNSELERKSVEEIQEEARNEKWEELREYYPQFFDKEGNFEFEKFKGYLTESNISTTVDGFSLNFVGKEYAKLLIDTPTDTLVSPNESDNNRETNKDSENIYLIGDNIDVLKHLRKSYTNSVDVIYIDPPYNTGSNDFTYPDTFQFSIEKLTEIFDDEEKAERIYNLSGKSSHSAWLTFMLPRIAIAHKLLKKEGIIFVSLDDNEISNMTLLCNDIFGESNRLGPIIQNKQNSKNDTKNIQKNHEYVLVYRKSAILESGKEKESLQVTSLKKQEVFEEDGDYYYLNDYITTRGDGGTLAKRSNLGYTVYYNAENKKMVPKMDYDKSLIRTARLYEELYTNDEDLISEGYFPIRPPKVRNQFGAWTWEIDKFIRDKKELIVTGTNPNYGIKKRTFVDNSKVFEEDGKFYIEMNVSSNSRSILDFSTNAGTTYFNELMETNDIFTNPKNVELVKYLLNLVPKQDCLVLDFFSGSATTADAVMRLNAENEKNNHKYILVQLPEELKEDNPAREKFGFSTIDEVGRERIRRAAKKIREETNKNIDYGFKTYYVHERPVPSIESIEEFSDDVSIQESLGLGTNIDKYAYREASGKSTLLTTWLIEDGFGFSTRIEEVKFGQSVGYLSGSRLYILDEGMTSNDLVELLRKIHEREINISNITVYVHSFSSIVLRELDLALKTINGLTLEKRY